jgi:hypothetical protein
MRKVKMPEFLQATRPAHFPYAVLLLLALLFLMPSAEVAIPEALDEIRSGN